jgi:hypothetical protein
VTTLEVISHKTGWATVYYNLCLILYDVKIQYVNDKCLLFLLDTSANAEDQADAGNRMFGCQFSFYAIIQFM